MAKEILTLERVSHDLQIAAVYKYGDRENWRLSYIIPFAMLAIVIGIVLRSVWIGILVFLPSIYHTVFLIKESRAYKENQKTILDRIERGEIGIAIEEISHVSEESTYEPYSYRRRKYAARCAPVVHFMSGGRWNVPTVRWHYGWSKEHYLSTKGLVNVSVQGNEVYYISLQSDHDVAYIYPRKLFGLGEDLEKSSEHT